MELSLLREFIVLSQTLNYTKAAEVLHLTQPTLSKHIVAMEKELGCSLLELRPTPGRAHRIRQRVRRCRPSDGGYL